MSNQFANRALLVFLALALAFFSVAAPRFATALNVQDILAGYSFLGMLALGQSFPILVRGIDLSIGAIVAVAGMVAFDLSLILHLPGCAVLLLAVASATLAGAVNGWMVVVLRLQPFIATLATLAAYRGLVFAISGRQRVPELSTTPISDPWITNLETYFEIPAAAGAGGVITMPAIPLSFVVLCVLLLVFQMLLRSTRFGRDVLTVGGNQEAARLAGIHMGRTIVIAYAISGLCAGIAAMFLVARLTTATEALGNGMELTAIAAAVIGGVSLQGGVGSMWGPVFGAFLLGVVLVGFTLMGVSQFVQQILTGIVLLGAVGHDKALTLGRLRRQALAGAQESAA